MSVDLLSRIRDLLRGEDIAFREMQHAATHTSAESAAARGQDLSLGAKALVLRIDDEFALFVLRADRRLDSGAIKKQLGAKRLRFATPEELFERTSLVPGSVPPFGEPILPFKLYADNSLANSGADIAFNAGSLTQSVAMSVADWQRVTNPIWLEFAEPPTPR
ncbi:MAG TPA: YbaK/EbsC family protein [Pirellulales bacterium]|jgi:Ala-tRNA(Pro) deacylase|nr:YbaK/EbsC family protein [Pirellulales bacterium]